MKCPKCGRNKIPGVMEYKLKFLLPVFWIYKGTSWSCPTCKILIDTDKKGKIKEISETLKDIREAIPK